jgi:hypothetical protein
MTASINRQAGPNAGHSRADCWGRVRLTLYPEKSLLFDLECDIMNVKYSSVFYISPHEAQLQGGLHGLALAAHFARHWAAEPSCAVVASPTMSR